jgi:NAD(P) transhydrogenase subunit beta
LNNILEISYLIASVTFILGLKMLGKPETARKGNLIAAGGMVLAIIATIFLYENNEGVKLGNYVWIFGGIIIGSIAGTIAARRVQMTAMPQMVSLFNGLGALCVAIISFLEYFHSYEFATPEFNVKFLIILAGLIIGSISFSGSMIAYGKLEGKIKDFHFPFNQVLNVLILLVILILLAFPVFGANHSLTILYAITILSLLYGLTFVFPIGGADMPVVISLLNSFTGIAAALGGFLYDNQVMLTGGILVGSSGTILTILMCKAMNRSLANVIVGSWKSQGSATTTHKEVKGSIKEISVSDTAVLLAYSKSVVIVPGYGLAVAQAQHVTKELEALLEDKGVEVKYAIHPVAGRMPGHMNVLLAEADVPYDKLLEMEQINPEFVKTDVVLILGANDVVNPAALTDPSSPIYGMPILEVINAKNIIVNKRSMSAGYAGIDNELFYNDKTKMLFGDSKKVLSELVSEVKGL